MLTDDFAEAAKLEKMLKSTEESAERAWNKEKALEKDRKNRRFFGRGPLKKDVLNVIGNSQHQRDCMYEDVERYKEKLKELGLRIAEQETAQAIAQTTVAMIDGLAQSGSAASISVRRPIQFKPRQTVVS